MELIITLAVVAAQVVRAVEPAAQVEAVQVKVLLVVMLLLELQTQAVAAVQQGQGSPQVLAVAV